MTSSWCDDRGDVGVPHSIGQHWQIVKEGESEEEAKETRRDRHTHNRAEAVAITFGRGTPPGCVYVDGWGNGSGGGEGSMRREQRRRGRRRKSSSSSIDFGTHTLVHLPNEVLRLL